MGTSKNPNELLLTSVYQNTQTGLQSIDNILPNIKCSTLVKELETQSKEYKVIAQECEKIAKEKRFELPDNNFFEKARLWSSIKMSTLTDRSTRHVTEMLLLGTFMGIIQCLKDFSDYHICDKIIINLLKTLQVLEESNLEKLKKFL